MWRKKILSATLAYGKPIRKSCVGQLGKYARDFCLSTAQHGLKYLVLPELTLTERSLWAVVVAFSVVFSIYFIWDALAKNSSTPTLTAIQSIHYPTYKFMFPAVTVCSLNKVHKTQALRLIDTLKLPTFVDKTELLDDFKLLTQLIEPTITNKTPQMIRLQDILDTNNVSVYKVMQTVTPRCSDMLLNCMWKGRRAKKCLKYFRPSITEEGFCCTFNYQATKDTLDSDYGNDEKYYKPLKKYKSEKSSACGHLMGLMGLIDNQFEEYHATLMASYGVKVLFHHPYNYPGNSEMSTIVEPGKTILYSITPVNFEAASEIRHISLSQRKCLFMNEISSTPTINGFYSLQNCLKFCRQKLSLKLCGCTPFYYPFSGNLNVCKLTDVPCLAKNEKILETLNHGETDDESLPCGCQPSCEETVYTMGHSKFDLRSEISSNMKSFYVHNTKANNSVINVFFTDTVGERYQTRRFHTWLGILASLGGLLSFFLGISITTLVETVYFFTIRIIFNKETQNEKTNKIAPKIESIIVQPFNTIEK